MSFPAPFTPVPLTLAGRTVPDSADLVIAYLEGRDGIGTANRIADYDFAALVGRNDFLRGLSPRITQGTIDSANNLMAQFHRTFAGDPLTDWFAPQEVTAPWDVITSGHTFTGADPAECGGQYDDICEIWSHFIPVSRTGRKNGIGETQVNKVLHQLFPNLIPIFDKRLNDCTSPSRRNFAPSSARHVSAIVQTIRGTATASGGSQCDRICWQSHRRPLRKYDDRLRHAPAEIAC